MPPILARDNTDDFEREPTSYPYDFTGGGNMLGGHFLSNTVVVPSGDLKCVFEELRD